MTYRAARKKIYVKVPTETIRIQTGENSYKTVQVPTKTTLEVDVDIQVDSAPFDRAAIKCCNQVKGLTTAVGVMNAA